jgi:hypothetical protein
MGLLAAHLHVANPAAAAATDSKEVWMLWRIIGRVPSAALAIAGLLVTGCAATMTVSSHVRHDIDFTQYRTYDWGPPDALPTGDPRLDQNPFFKDHLQGAVERGLAARGFKLSTSGTPDLLIHYHASITNRINVAGADARFGDCYDEDCRAWASEYEAGTIILDIVDPRTNQVIWRGWAQASVEGMLDDPDRMQRRIDEAVTRMLARLPQGLSPLEDPP